MFQGRVDYAFDVTQALNGYTRINGPKHLYVGQFGHTPSTFPGPDFAYVLSQGVAWFDHYLKGAPNGIDKSPPVTIAAATGTKRASYAGAAEDEGRRRSASAAPRCGAPGPRFGQALETFGVSLLKVQVRKVVATTRASSRRCSPGNRVITHGAIVPKVGLNTIRLANYVQYLPKGTRLTVVFGPSSGSADVAYLGFGDAGSISLGAGDLDAAGADEAGQRMRARSLRSAALRRRSCPAALAGSDARASRRRRSRSAARCRSPARPRSSARSDAAPTRTSSTSTRTAASTGARSSTSTSTTRTTRRRRCS